jgi:hypothetical protein
VSNVDTNHQWHPSYLPEFVHPEEAAEDAYENGGYVLQEELSAVNQGQLVRETY